MSFWFRRPGSPGRQFRKSGLGFFIIAIASLLFASSPEQANAGGSWGSSRGGFGIGGSSGYGCNGGSFGSRGSNAPIRNLLSRIGSGIGNGIAGIGNGIAAISERRPLRNGMFGSGGSRGGWGCNGGYASAGYASTGYSSNGGWGSNGATYASPMPINCAPALCSPSMVSTGLSGNPVAFNSCGSTGSMTAYQNFGPVVESPVGYPVNQYETSAPVLDYGYMGSQTGMIGVPTNAIMVDGNYITGGMMEQVVPNQVLRGSAEAPGYYNTPDTEAEEPPIGAVEEDDTTSFQRPGKAILSLDVPEDAKVYINDKLTRTKGQRRSYASRNLRIGEDYRYRVKVIADVEGKEVIKTRVVTMRPGERNLVEFNFAPVVTRVVLNVPEDAKVVIDGKETTTPGALRSFATQKLTEGKWDDYSVEVSVVRDGKTLTRTEKFDLVAGEFKYFQFSFDDDQSSPESVALN